MKSNKILVATCAFLGFCLVAYSTALSWGRPGARDSSDRDLEGPKNDPNRPLLKPKDDNIDWDNAKPFNLGMKGFSDDIPTLFPKFRVDNDFTPRPLQDLWRAQNRDRIHEELKHFNKDQENQILSQEQIEILQAKLQKRREQRQAEEREKEANAERQARYRNEVREQRYRDPHYGNNIHGQNREHR